VALQTNDDDTISSAAVRDIQRAPDVIVTDVAALTEIGSDSDERPARPIQALVRGNLVRGGRGLIFEDTARWLTSSDVRSGVGDPPTLGNFNAIVRDVFSPDAATRLERAAQLLEIGVSADIGVLLGETEEDAVRGRLSDSEMRILLPYLLRRDDVTTDPVYWTHLGAMFNLERLESMAPELSGVNLTSLVAPNLRQWTASRASLGFYADAVDEVELDEEDDSDRVPNPLGLWHFHSRMLGIVLGQWRIHLAADGKRLKGRPTGIPARWDDLAPALQRFSLAGVELVGLQRHLEIATERGADVYADVTAIRESIDDEFHVPSVTVRLNDSESTGAIVVSFTT
jgi:hypothetical protein